MKETENTDYRYYAFISYSRKNTKDAVWLQKKLETYRLPSVLQKQYEELPSKLKVFRDQTDIDVGGPVPATLSRELKDSKKLIVLCSPDSVKSEYVEYEIKAFLELGRSSSDIYTFIVDGKIEEGNPSDCYTPTLHELNINAADAVTEGRRKAFIRLLAGLLGIKYDDLVQREKVRFIRKCSLAAFAVTAVLVIAFFCWDFFFHTKVKYYADYADSNALPQGIFELDKEQMENLAFRYRFESRAKKLRRLVCENARGTPHNQPNTEFSDRYAVQEFEYDEKTKSLIKTVCKDETGKIMAVYDWPSDLDYTRANIRNQGKASQGLKSSVTSISREPDNSRSPIRSIVYERDKNGFIQKEYFYMYHNSRKPACDAAGIYGFEYVRDEYGRVLEKWYLGRNGERHSDQNGIAGRLYSYKGSNLCETRYVDRDGNPALNELGWEICRADFDKYGNTVKEEFLDESLNLFPHSEGIFGSGFRYKNGLLVEEKYFDAEGNPSYSKQGVCSRIFDYDKFGRIIRESYYGINGEPVFIKEGYSSVGKSYNEDGFVETVSFYGTDGEGIFNSEGIAIFKKKYNSRGQVTEESCYSPEGEPVWNKYGYSVLKLSYDERGNEIKREFFDTDGITRVRINEGWSSAVYEYDSNGNCTETAFFDTEEKPFAMADNVHKTKRTYDEDSGNADCYYYFGTDGKPVCSDKGYACVKYEFDEGGNILSEKYFDENGSPAMCEKTFCEIRYKYENGQLIEKSVYGRNGEYASSSAPCLYKYKYDLYGNLAEGEFFRYNGENVSGKTYRVLKVRFVYDKRKLCLMEESVDDNGKPVLYGTRKWPTYEYEYDVFGNKIAEKYFGVNGEPYVRDDGVHSTRWKYDRLGNVIEESYFDKYGNSVSCVDGYAKVVSKFDRLGNCVKYTAYDTLGNLLKLEGMASEARFVYDDCNRKVLALMYAGFDDWYQKRTFNKDGSIKNRVDYHKLEWQDTPGGKALSLYGNDGEQMNVYFDSEDNITSYENLEGDVWEVYAYNGRLIERRK